MNGQISGADAVARGAIEAGVSFVTGYPGAPATAVVDALLAMTSYENMLIEWASNEKVAIELAYGASLAGRRSLLCVKGVGLNIALDPLMAFNLAGCNAGFVILVGDDPGGWGSQNEQDSRTLAMMAELPLVEPTSVSEAWIAMRQAFQISEAMGLPVIVRITRALIAASQEMALPEIKGEDRNPETRSYQRALNRWVVLPVNVIERHTQLLQKLDSIRDNFERSSLNGLEGKGSRGVIAAGFVYQKLKALLGDKFPAELRVLRLGTIHPLPSKTLTDFVCSVESVVVFEETAPLVERAVREILHRNLSVAGHKIGAASAEGALLAPPVYGRDTGHVPCAGELFDTQLADALVRILPGLALISTGERSRPMPSREPLCDRCPYIPTFEALNGAMIQAGGREAFIVVGDPGCMVRAQLPPYELLDVKNSLGSSIATAAGIALGMSQPGVREPDGRWPSGHSGRMPGKSGKRIIALCGDSGFLHSGFDGLMDAARFGAKVLVILLDNGTSALSGGQPHPASRVDARGRPQRMVDLEGLARQAGVGMVSVVDLDRGEDIGRAIEAGLDFDGVATIIARGRCPLRLKPTDPALYT
jgi:indolepyruvate ferredoxin oxidoreductase alpha subunit